MNKNDFLIFNNLVSKLYTCKQFEDLRFSFLEPLRMLIPYHYSSLFLANLQAPEDMVNDAELLIPDPLCVPRHFRETELKYLDYIQEDRTLWLLKSKESVLIRESDLFPDENRLSAAIYVHCYQRYGIYDIMQYSIVHQEQFLGVLTLFRTRAGGYFGEEDMFYLQSLGIHLNTIIYNIITADSREHARTYIDISHLKEQYQLTEQESKILELVFQFLEPEEITAELGVKPNTLQKHMQNLYRKFNVASKWELLKFR